jgi:hypothetical protein
MPLQKRCSGTSFPQKPKATWAEIHYQNNANVPETFKMVQMNTRVTPFQLVKI